MAQLDPAALKSRSKDFSRIHAPQRWSEQVFNSGQPAAECAGTIPRLTRLSWKTS